MNGLIYNNIFNKIYNIKIIHIITRSVYRVSLCEYKFEYFGFYS